MTAKIEQVLFASADLLMEVSFVQFKTLGAKTLPLLLAACAPSTGRRVWAFSCTLIACLIAVVLARTESSFLRSAMAVVGVLGYYSIAATCWFWVQVRIRPGTLRKDVLFCILGFIFVVAPAPVLRRIGQVELLVLGWGTALSAYSYCVEAARASHVSTLRGFLFFVLVDPTLSFPERARRAPVRGGAILKRLLNGFGLMVSGDLLLRGWMAGFVWLDGLLLPLKPALIFALAALVAFFVAYWVRAGAADVRIGLMQTLGFQVPECFHRPHLATSPLDFWRRWNRWVGDWVKRYLFMPLALVLRRRSMAYGIGASVAQAGAIIGSFAMMGLLHDWLLFANHGASTFVYLRVFLCAAAGLLVWEVTAAQLRRTHVSGQSALRQRAANVGAAAYISVLIAIAGRI